MSKCDFERFSPTAFGDDDDRSSSDGGAPRISKISQKSPDNPRSEIYLSSLIRAEETHLPGKGTPLRLPRSAFVDCRRRRRRKVDGTNADGLKRRLPPSPSSSCRLACRGGRLVEPRASVLYLAMRYRFVVLPR